MDLTTSDWTQLIAAVTLSLIVFVLAYVLPPRYSVGLLILLAPFQMIASRFGTLNIGLIYVVGAAHLLRGRIRSLPFAPIFGLILLTYLISMSQAPRATFMDHSLYIVGILANFVLFYVVYNHVRQTGDTRPVLRLFVVMNGLVLLYCVIQLVTGYERFAFLGVPEFGFAEISETKQRLVGPFGTAGTNGEVFVLQILLLGYLILHQPRGLLRHVMVGMLLANFAFLIMTGSRGSFLTMVGSGLLFLWFFRRQLGFGRTVRIAVASVAAFAIVAVVVITFSEFNLLFERLEATELREGLPDTRAVAFREAWQRIPEHPIVGHGPQLRLIDEINRHIPGHEFLYFPHNLYLFLPLTIGIVGLIAYLFLFWAFYRWWSRARHVSRDSAFEQGLPTLGILLLIAFLVDQLKIEFLRSQYTDLQQYLFSLWAILLAGTTGGRASAGTR
jgi:O-antigen ligase